MFFLRLCLFLYFPLVFLPCPGDGAIKIIQDSSRKAIGRLGESVVLKCRTNEHWEYCTWKHISRGSTCNFEWKYSSGNVERTQCPSLWQRAVFSGDYYKHECNINLTSVKEQDFGQWTCIIEDYVLFGGRGAVVKGYVDLEKDVLEEDSFTESLSTTTEDASSALSWADLATTQSISPRFNANHPSKEGVIRERAPIYEATSDGSSNAFLAVGLIVGLMFVLFFLAIGVLAYRRRQKSEREFEWLTNKKKNIPITEVVPDDQYDPEQNCLDINPNTNTVKYLDTRKASSIIEPPELRLF